MWMSRVPPASGGGPTLETTRDLSSTLAANTDSVIRIRPKGVGSVAIYPDPAADPTGTGLSSG